MHPQEIEWVKDQLPQKKSSSNIVIISYKLMTLFLFYQLKGEKAFNNEVQAY